MPHWPSDSTPSAIDMLFTSPSCMSWNCNAPNSAQGAAAGPPDARQRSGPDVQRVGWVGVEGAARVGPLYDLGAGRRPLHIGSKRHRRFGRLRTLREVDDGGARGLVQHRGQRPRLRPQTQLDEWQVPSHHAGLGRAPPGDSWRMPARHPRASSGGSGGACAWQCVALI